MELYIICCIIICSAFVKHVLSFMFFCQYTFPRLQEVTCFKNHLFHENTLMFKLGNPWLVYQVDDRLHVTTFFDFVPIKTILPVFWPILDRIFWDYLYRQFQPLGFRSGPVFIKILREIPTQPNFQQEVLAEE